MNEFVASRGDALPVGIREPLRAALPAVVEEVVTAVAEQVPAYRRPLRGRFGEVVRHGVEVALARFLDEPASSSAALSSSERDVYVKLGRGELLQGRSLEALLAAYRVGSRVAFRRFAELALAAGLPGEAVVPLAEATFAYMEELSAASIEGFAEEQSRQAGRRDRQRQELLDELLAGTLDEITARTAADAVGWTLPEVLVVVLAPSADGRLQLRLGAAALVGTRGRAAVALVPPDERLDRRLAGRPSAVSAPTPWRELPTALHTASLLLHLPPTGGPVHVEDRLVDLLLARDPALTQALVARLAPLEAARPGTRERLAETLAAWLAHRGSRQAVANALHLHVQTVAYRLSLLRTLLGDALDSPAARLELELALRARPLLDADPAP